MELVRESNDQAELVTRAIQGDSEAFGELYLVFLDPIFRYIYLRTGDTNDAEDLAEQVFLKAWQALPGYKQQGFPFSCWLYRIAHNLIVDYHRRRKSTLPWQVSPSEDPDESSPVGSTSLPDQDESISLAAAISNLSDEQQQVIVLRFVEGMGYEELSPILNKSEGACRMIQNRALKALYSLMNRDQGM